MIVTIFIINGKRVFSMDDNKRSNRELNTTIAKLESKIDYLESEVLNLNDLLIKFGFSKGIQSLRLSIEEILSVDRSSED